MSARPQPITIAGVVYPSRAAAAAAMGVTGETLRNWIVKQREIAPRINISALAREHGLAPSTVRCRMVRGMKLQRALTARVFR